MKNKYYLLLIIPAVLLMLGGLVVDKKLNGLLLLMNDAKDENLPKEDWIQLSQDLIQVAHQSVNTLIICGVIWLNPIGSILILEALNKKANQSEQDNPITRP